MSTTVLAPEHASVATPSAGPAPRTSVARVVRSEWIKQRSLRSTWITLGVLLTMIVGFGLYASYLTGNPPPGEQRPLTTDVIVGNMTAGAQFGIIVVAVLGVVVGAREYSSGLIRTTLAAVPRRWPVLLGKVLVFVALVLPVVLVGVAVAFAGGSAILTAVHVTAPTLSTPGVLRALVGTVGYVVGIGVLGVALGVLFRGMAAGIGVLVGGLMFLPTLLLALLPHSWSEALKYLPSNAGQAITTTTDDPSLLSYGAGAAVLAAWAALSLAAATWALMRRDA
jgi:ABC-2 type transport system permease protein